MKPAPDRRLSSLKLKHGLWVTFPLCRVDTGLLSCPTRLFFSSSRPPHKFSAAEPQNLPPQGRRISIWREHGVVRARAAAQSCAASAQNCSAAPPHDVQWLWGKLGGTGCTQLRLTCCVLHRCGCARIAALCFTVLREICDEIFLHWSTTLSASPPHNLRMTCLLVPAILFYDYYYYYIYYYYYY